jgi:hypothetical protein
VMRMVSFRAGHPATRAAVQGIRHDVFTSITPDCHLCGVAQSNQHLSRPQTNERTNERTNATATFMLLARSALLALSLAALSRVIIRTTRAHKSAVSACM